MWLSPAQAPWKEIAVRNNLLYFSFSTTSYACPPLYTTSRRIRLLFEIYRESLPRKRSPSWKRRHFWKWPSQSRASKRELWISFLFQRINERFFSFFLRSLIFPISQPNFYQIVMKRTRESQNLWVLSMTSFGVCCYVARLRKVFWIDNEPARHFVVRKRTLFKYSEEMGNG